MGAEANEFQDQGCRFSIDKQEVWPDMTLPAVTEFADKCMIVKSWSQGIILRKPRDQAVKLNLQKLPKLAFALPLQVAPEAGSHLDLPHPAP